MINLSTVKTTLITWAATNSGLSRVILANQNAPRPTLPYLTILLTPFIAIGDDYIYPPDVAGVRKIKGNREFTVTINAFGTNAINYLQLLINSLEKPSVLEYLRANGIVFIRKLAINDVTALLETVYEERSICDIQFRLGENFTDNNSWIDQVELVENYFDDQSIIETNLYLIPPTL
jgi:hypothetical protein